MTEQIRFALFEHTGINPYSIKHSSIITRRKGEKADLSHGVGLVSKGSLKVTRADTGAVLNVITEGGMFGVSTLYAGNLEAGTELTAISDTEIVFFAEEDFALLLSRNFTLLKNYLAIVSKKICFLNGKVGTLASQTAESRILHHILQNGGTLKVSSMTELANMLSMGRASLYRALNQLEAEGKIKRDGKTVTLL